MVRIPVSPVYGMLGFLVVKKGRGHAELRIQPLVKRSIARCGEWSSTRWQDPYVIGFFGILITRFAENGVGRRINDASLARIQSHVWARFSGLEALLFGEEICRLSALHDENFLSGGDDAEYFSQIYLSIEMKIRSDILMGYGATSDDRPLLDSCCYENSIYENLARHEIISFLWSDYVDPSVHGRISSE